MADRISWSDFPRLRDNDVFQVTIRNAVPNQITFSLTTASNVRWWKSIKLVNISDGSIIKEVTTQDDRHGPNSFVATASDISGAKFVLAKAKIFGVHTDMYEIYELTEKLGQEIDLSWNADSPDNIFGAVWGFVSDVVTGAVNAVVTVVNAVVTTVETIVGVITNAVLWLFSVILAIPIIGRLISLIINAIVWLIGSIVNAIVDLVFGILSLIGLVHRPPEKLLRLCIIIQRDENGKPVTTMKQILPQLDFAIKLYKERANVKIIPSRGFFYTSPFGSGPIANPDFVITEDQNSDATTLDVRCDAGAFLDNFWLAGSQFEIKMSQDNFWGNTRRIVGMGSPICVFAVRSFTDPAGDVGCSTWLAADYVTVNFDSPVSVMAHEMSHACNLPHVNDTTNLMNPTALATTTELTGGQVALIRLSPHCSLF